MRWCQPSTAGLFSILTSVRKAQSVPTSLPVSQPTPNAQCAAAYGQCAGTGWNGPYCCIDGKIFCSWIALFASHMLIRFLVATFSRLYLCGNRCLLFTMRPFSALSDAVSIQSPSSHPIASGKPNPCTNNTHVAGPLCSTRVTPIADAVSAPAAHSSPCSDSSAFALTFSSTFPN